VQSLSCEKSVPRRRSRGRRCDLRTPYRFLELKRFEEGHRKGHYITPPAGAIGRGDAFILKIAEKVKAVVLSNDSFQDSMGNTLGSLSPIVSLSLARTGRGWIFVPARRFAVQRAVVRFEVSQSAADA